MKERVKMITIIVVIINILTALVALLFQDWNHAVLCLLLLSFYFEIPNIYNESYPFVNSFRAMCLKKGKARIYCIVMGFIYAITYTCCLALIIKNIVSK